MESKFKDQYDNLIPLYKRLADNLQQALKEFLIENNVSILTIDSRIKSWDTFIEKIERKGYNEPFEQTEDFCGIRIICYYQSDIQIISSIINKEFEVLESQDKETLLSSDQFGYRSYHFIIRIPNNWLTAPNYRGLENLKAEIQVRTILMHAWAEIQHKLAYKRENQIESEIKRKFSRISAKLEEADEQFEELRKISKSYRDNLIANQKVKGDTFKNLKSIDLDSLQAFLDYHFPKRKREKTSTAKLLEELFESKITFNDLNDIFEGATNFATSVMENEERTVLTQTGMIRWPLYMINEKYWNYYKEKVIGSNPFWVKKIEDWRKRFKNNNA